MSRGFDINGEWVTESEANSLIRMMYEDAKRTAGEFHNMERSEKFRANYPNEYLFAETQWKNFVVAVREMYLERIRDKKTLESEKKKMFQALYVERLASLDSEQDTRLQIKPHTQQFEGDKHENKKIADKFGKQSNTFAELALGTTALADGVVKH
jgi:hypothetical protein